MNISHEVTLSLSLSLCSRTQCTFYLMYVFIWLCRYIYSNLATFCLHYRVWVDFNYYTNQTVFSPFPYPWGIVLLKQC